jgi:hypothetical protein
MIFGKNGKDGRQGDDGTDPAGTAGAEAANGGAEPPNETVAGVLPSPARGAEEARGSLKGPHTPGLYSESGRAVRRERALQRERDERLAPASEVTAGRTAAGQAVPEPPPYAPGRGAAPAERPGRPPAAGAPAEAGDPARRQAAAEPERSAVAGQGSAAGPGTESGTPLATGLPAGTCGAATGAVAAPGAPGQSAPGRGAAAVPHGRLIGEAEGDALGRRLEGALSHFVDEPRRSVEEAADVFEEAARRLVAALADRPRALRAAWDGGEGSAGDTEALRLALRGYRETTERLLRT